MTVTAGSGGLNGWTVAFDASATITSIWNAQIVSHVGNHYVVSNAAWNGQVAGGQAVSFGFQATPGSAGTTASGFTINGVAAGHDPVPPPVPPSLSVADATVTEGNSGTSDLAFTVTLSAAATSPVTVAYATANGTATAGSDYAASAGTLTFAAGETSKVVHVQVTGDSVVEANETLTLEPVVAERRHHRARHGDRHHRERRYRAAAHAQHRRFELRRRQRRRAGTWHLHRDAVGCRDGAGHRALRHCRRHGHRRQRLCRPVRHAHLRARRDAEDDHRGGDRRFDGRGQ